MNIPSQISKGDSHIWDDAPTTDNLGNTVDSSLWTLNYHIRGPVSLDLLAVAEGTGWRTTLSTVNSATLTTGTYYWQAVATKSGAKLTLGSGQLKVSQDLSGALANYDGRSQAEQDLAAVQAAIRAIATGGVKSYTIGNRSMTKTDMGELRAWESELKAEVAREKTAEKVAAGLGNPRKSVVRFT